MEADANWSQRRTSLYHLCIKMENEEYLLSCLRYSSPGEDASMLGKLYACCRMQIAKHLHFWAALHKAELSRFHRQTLISNPGRDNTGSCHMRRKSTLGTAAHTNEFKLVVTKLLFLFSSLTIYEKAVVCETERSKKWVYVCNSGSI